MHLPHRELSHSISRGRDYARHEELLDVLRGIVQVERLLQRAIGMSQVEFRQAKVEAGLAAGADLHHEMLVSMLESGSV